MTNENDFVKVNGNFTTDAYYSHEGYLTNGILEVKGNFTQLRNNENFYATNGHKVILSGDEKQTISLINANARFATLEITNTSDDGVYVTSYFNADSIIDDNKKLSFANGKKTGWKLEKDETVEGFDLIYDTLDLNGHTLTVPVEELNIDEKQLAQHDGLLGSFVFYQEAWHLNGLLVSMHLNGRFEEMRSQCRDIPQEGTRSYSSEELKQMFGGKTLIYTKDSNEMKKLLQKKMKYSKTVDLNQLNSDKPVTLFIDDKDTYYNQFFSFDTAPCIKDATNPYYNPKQAQAEAIDMLWDEERCTTHMAEYLVEHDMLPDAYHQPEFRPAVSASQQKADLLFFMRYHRSKNV